MSGQLYLCVHAAEFPAQALLRLRPELRAEAVAVLEGRAPLEMVCSLNRLAQQKGAALGMTRLEAEEMAGLRLLARSPEGEAAAKDVLLECAARFSPRIEAMAEDTAFSCALDIAGTERLFGPAETLAQRLRDALLAAGFRTSIAVSANFHAARLKAAASRGIAVIQESEERQALARLPLSVLKLEMEQQETFSLWGIAVLGDLAALDEVELIARLGQQGKRWRDLALGTAPHTLQPLEPEFALKEYCEFETHVEDLNALLFVGARMIDCLVGRASSRALSLASLTFHMGMAGGRVHRRVIRPALPSIDRKFLLKLLQLELAAHPPRSAVIWLSLTAEAGRSSKVQLGLFAPQMPEPSRLDVTMMRLKAMVGEERVGSPVLEDTHRPDSFRMQGFYAVAGANGVKAHPPRTAVRRMRPPVVVRVTLRERKPAAFRDEEHSYAITAAFGPWTNSGCWWSTDGWEREEWDVLAELDGASLACLLVRDAALNQWRLEAYYD